MVESRKYKINIKQITFLVLLSIVSTTSLGFFEARAEIQKYFRWFLVQMKTFKSAFEINDLSFASTETKFIKPKTKTQNNIVIFGFFHKKMILSFWLLLK